MHVCMSSVIWNLMFAASSSKTSQREYREEQKWGLESYDQTSADARGRTQQLHRGHRRQAW